MGERDLHQAVEAGIRNVASVSLELGYPTLAAAPHLLVLGYKTVLALALGAGFPLKVRDGRLWLGLCRARWLLMKQQGVWEQQGDRGLLSLHYHPACNGGLRSQRVRFPMKPAVAQACVSLQTRRLSHAVLCCAVLCCAWSSTGMST